MKEQLSRIEKKIDDLIVSVEHRLTKVETTQRGIKWLVCLLVAAAMAVVTL